MAGFEIKLATRHLTTGGGQTLLTIGAVAAGVTVVIFISSLVFGIRGMYTRVLTQLLPMVTVSPPDPTPLTLAETHVGGFGLSSTKVERHSAQNKYIDSPEAIIANIKDIPGVAFAAPVVAGQGFVSRGGRRIGSAITGADPERLLTIQDLGEYITGGHYIGLASDEVVVNYKLMTDLNLVLGDRVFVTSSAGVTESFRVAGLIDTGQSPNDAAYVALRQGQSLFQTGTSVTNIYIRCKQLFDADDVADRVMALTPYHVDSWSRLYPQFVSSLAVYGAVAYVVSAFSLMASGFAIASVLIVSVVQRSKQIGILKGIGARNAQIQALFLYEGFGIAVVGAVVGALGGCGVVRFLSIFKRAGAHPGVPPDDMFPSDLTWQLVALAMAAAILVTIVAAVLPARRAARLNPVDVIK